MAANRDIADEVIAACHNAAEANRRAALRQGNVIVIPRDAQGEVFISGDLHGDRRNFDRILELADLDRHPYRHLIMQEVCHGGPTYPDSMACMSHLMLEDVARLKVRYPERFHFLLSNHELAELTDFPIVKSCRMLNLQFRSGLRALYGDDDERVRAGYLEFINTCPLAVRIADNILATHSVPAYIDKEGFDTTVFQRQAEPADVGPGGPVFRLVWGRDFRQENVDAFAALAGVEILVNGHEPCPDGYRAPNTRQIILDGQGDKASYLIVPTDRAWTHEELVARVNRLHE